MEEKTISSLIGVRLVYSKMIGAERHNEWRTIVMVLLILFVFCGVIAILTMSGLIKYYMN